MNQGMFVGNLTKDAELRYSNSGTAIVSFDVAVNDKEKKGDQWEDYASFFKCTMFGKRAEAVHKYLVKGQRVGITARIRQDRWEKDGQKHSMVKFMVNDLDLLGNKSASEPSQTAEPSSDFEDDCPF